MQVKRFVPIVRAGSDSCINLAECDNLELAHALAKADGRELLEIETVYVQIDAPGKYVMSDATRERAIELQESAAYWYFMARNRANGIGGIFDIDQIDLTLDTQELAARYAAKYRAILCD